MLDPLVFSQNIHSMVFGDSLPWILAADVSLLQSLLSKAYNIGMMLLGLGFVIFVHELGHFLAAKMFGVKCEKFYVGFDVPMKIGPIRLPSRLARFQWGETEYGIGSIPLGGYVKMLGQDDDPRKLKEENQRIGLGEDQEQTVKLDPRSYPAKPVFARMIIISAGVIMNLIFGVLMAAAAFSLGVPYTPSILGGTMPGEPAWQAGLKPGDRIVGVGTSEDDQMSFEEIKKKVAIGGIRNASEPIELTYERQGQRNKVKVSGSMAHANPDARLNFQSIGIRATSTTTVGSDAMFEKLQELEGKKPSTLQPGDKILGVDGVLLESNDKAGEFFGYQLDEVLHPRLDKKVELSVERNTGSSKQTLVVPIDPLPLKTMGLRFAPDAVTVVASDSPAAVAGIRMGDIPTKLNGQVIEDAITLPNRIATMAGQSVKVEFARANSDPIVLEWTVPNRFLLENDLPRHGAVGMELPGAGLVYLVSPKITSIVPGSEASKSGLQAGDLLKQVAFGKLSDTQASYLKETNLETLFSKPTPVDNVKNLQYIHNWLYLLPAGLPLDLVVEREAKIETATVEIHEETNLFSPYHRIALAPYRQTYYAKSVGGALEKGFQEIRRGIGDVLEFLGLIVTGKAFKYIGGPVSIATQGAAAASEGVSTLLMFLTLLSANLAVVNFLPVPALDGGHMVFLAAEAITGKPVNEDLQVKLTIGGIIALLCLMILTFRNDFLHLFGAWM